MGTIKVEPHQVDLPYRPHFSSIDWGKLLSCADTLQIFDSRDERRWFLDNTCSYSASEETKEKFQELYDRAEKAKEAAVERHHFLHVLETGANDSKVDKLERILVLAKERGLSDDEVRGLLI